MKDSNGKEIPAHILKRKGSITTSGVPVAVQKLLNQGLIETVNLVEWLIVDQEFLSRNLFHDFGWSFLLDPLRKEFALLTTKTAPKKLELIGRVLSHFSADKTIFNDAYNKLKDHRSDVVRSWACMMNGQRAELSLGEKLNRIRPLAADKNPNVRESAWLALRPPIANELPEALRLLVMFSKNKDANIRRFASEATRPRGVWCNHIAELKENPEIGLPILEPLKSDSSKYVRDSVGNWLNDASKTKPDWVRELCCNWEKASPTLETAYIVRRALRTLNKTEE